ncbi:MAG: branched-chain amino acid ABC transporter permease, partial [Oscillospiraceae bacterium]|nr:branched-chain amino acid ABC transporter permease [Oscillospiraceae bacterium]
SFIMNSLISSGGINRYYSRIIYSAGIYVIAAVSLNLTCGFLGQLPLGHAGFMALGAYTSALITKSADFGSDFLNFLVALLAAGLVSAVFGFVIGLPALRLKGDYLAIITLAFGEMIRVIINNLGFTGGAMGLKQIPRYTSFTWVYAVCLVTVFVSYTLIHSKHGREIISIRENEIAAESCGVNITYFKSLTFVIAAFFAGLAGALYANYIGTISPSIFDFNKSIEILVMVVLGGMGSIVGSVVSASVLTALPEMLRGFDDYRMVAYSLLLVVVMIFKPSGLMGNYELSLGGALDSLLAKLRSGLGIKKKAASEPAAGEKGGESE